jgi:hypothetical protein
MSSLADRTDQLLSLTKWPTAALALILLPGIGFEFVEVCQEMATKATLFPSFLLGCAAYIAAWWLWFRKRIWGSAFSTLEHELTHALFGLLTFRIIRGIKISWSGGGHVRFAGRANWLIYIAPYWFPTLTLALIPVVWLVETQHQQTALALLGASLGFHLSSTFREIHPSQSDLQTVGFAFSLCVLPVLNLLSVGAIIAYMLGGFGGVGDFIVDGFEQTLSLAEQLT